jgi:DNA-binding response OmpR family regulator
VSERPLVLVADDDPDILSLVTLRLERDGYEVIGAPDGERAVEEALERTPDLALIDVSMPKLDGYEVRSGYGSTSRQARSRSSCSPHASRIPTLRAGSRPVPTTT